MVKVRVRASGMHCVNEGPHKDTSTGMSVCASERDFLTLSSTLKHTLSLHAKITCCKHDFSYITEKKGYTQIITEGEQYKEQTITEKKAQKNKLF